MTTDPDRRLAHALTTYPAHVRRLRDAFIDDKTKYRLAHELAEVLDLTGDGDPEDADESVHIIADALDYVLSLLEAAGGPSAGSRDLELLLDAQAVADVVLTTVNNLAEDLAASCRAAGWEEIRPGVFRHPEDPL